MSQFESSEDENESEEEHSEGHYYEEVRGEYEDDEYNENGEEEDWYLQHSPRHSGRSRSTRSSQRTSMGTSENFFAKSFRKSMGLGLLGTTFFEEEIQHHANQDLLDALPEDISTFLVDYWQRIEGLYDSVVENAFGGIHKSHKKVSSYPGVFQEAFSKQLEIPDDRAKLADDFKSDFNRVPALIRTSDQVKPVLLKRIGELLVKVEGVTEEKYANSKQTAYKILSKSCITPESEKMAQSFGALLQAETDRFADTIKFINEHYYNTIAVDLGMPNKVRWKEIMEIGLIKKKFLCERFREQCLMRGLDEQNLMDGEAWTVAERDSSSDSDLCGGGLRGQDFSLICEDEDDSTPSDEEMTDESLFRKYGEEEEQMDFGENEAKMSGEMKLSLAFDNEEFLGEGGWDSYTVQRNSAVSAETARDEEGSREAQMDDKRKSHSSKTGKKNDGTGSNQNEGGNQILEAPKALSQGGGSKMSKMNENSKGKEEKENKSSNKQSGAATDETSKRKSKESQRNSENRAGQGEDEESRFDFPEEYDEELEMEPEIEVQNPDYYDEEYPGEFWEGEGYGTGSYRKSKSIRNRDSSVKFDEKETYIRDFFWDSDPSKQDATDMSKAEKEVCMDEGYFDQEEIFDEEDVLYDRDEFFEMEGENSSKSKSAYILEEPIDLHFAIFGKYDDRKYSPISLLNQLLMKWHGHKERAMMIKKQKAVRKDSNKKKRVDMILEEGKEFDDNAEEEEEDEEEATEEEDNGKDRARFASIDSSVKYFSPSTPASAVRQIDNLQEVNHPHETTEGVHESFRSSFFDFSGGHIGLLKLSPDSETKINECIIPNPIADKMLQQKRPLLECFVNLHDEIWHGFEDAFVEARINIQKLAEALKEIVSRAYPIEEPKDPCEEEVDLNELVAKGEAIKEKYLLSGERHVDRTTRSHKHVQMKESFDEEEGVEIFEERESSSVEEEEAEEEENNEGSPKSSFVDIVAIQSPNMSGDRLPETSDTPTAHESTEKRSSVTDSEQRKLKLEKTLSIIEADDSGKKKSTLLHHEEFGSGSNSTREKKQSQAEESGTGDEDKDNEKKQSTTESTNIATESEKVITVLADEVNSPQSQVTESTDPKLTALERTTGEIDIRLQESPLEPTPEEKKILKRGKLALLKLKLQNWEKTLDLETERLTRQLAVIEAHAQHEFRLLKELPLKIWESSKSQAANVYMDDLKRNAELGDVFKTATESGSPLYGNFYIDRRDLMLLLKDNQIAIPLRYTDEYEELMNSGAKKSRKSEYLPMEE